MRKIHDMGLNWYLFRLAVLNNEEPPISLRLVSLLHEHTNKPADIMEASILIENVEMHSNMARIDVVMRKTDEFHAGLFR